MYTAVRTCTVGVAMVREQSRLKFDRMGIMLNGNRAHSAAEYYGQRDMEQDQWDYYSCTTASAPRGSPGAAVTVAASAEVRCGAPGGLIDV